MGTRARTFFGFAAACLLIGGGVLHAATLPAGFTESAWGNSIAQFCTAMAFAPDGRLFVCQQNGALRVIDADGTLLGPAFVSLTVDTNGERGLLGVAFDPNFSSNHFVYVYHTVPGGSGPSPTPPPHNRITRFTANGNVATGAGTTILDLDNLSLLTIHNGGGIHFGPDGKLYVAVGDNGNSPNSQSLANRLGKILRINPDGSLPTNPANPTTFPGIMGSPSGANQAIWAVGLRNPFTFAFQPGTTRMFINDVGLSTWEEVNDGIAGSNYGWPVVEGPAPSPSPTPSYRYPLLYYGHGSNSTSTGCAIVGAAFYNPDILQFPTSYVGKYFFGDLCNGWIRVMDTSNNTSSVFASGITGQRVDLHVGPDGALYYLVQSGQVMRVQANPSQPLNISTRARVETGDNVLIGGFIITGSVAKKVIVRAIGPSLSGLVPGALADPVLELHAPGGALITSNDNWQDDPAQKTEIMNSGLAPSNDLESSIVATLQPGAYTAIVRGKNGTGGVGLAEIFDLDTAASSQLGNMSGRGFVQTGDNVMIGGLIVGNNIGAARVVVRAIGPSLSGAGVNNPLADPILELHDSNGALIGVNDNWQDDPDQAALITDSGLAPSNALESAMLTGLAPGPYTAIIRGKNGGTGVGLIEVFKVQ
jgi:glucose/arabinose dehydrogenase